MTTSDDSREFVQAAEKELKVLKDESGYLSLIGKIASKLEKAASHQHLADALEDFEQFKKFHGGNKGFSSVIRLWNVFLKLLPHVEENEKKLVETCMERLVALEQMISLEIDKDLRNLLEFEVKMPDSGIINWDKVKELAIKIQEQVAGIKDIEQTLMRILRKEEVKAASHITPQHYNWGGSWENIMSTLQKILSSYIDDEQLIAEYLKTTWGLLNAYRDEVFGRAVPILTPFWLFYALAHPKVMADANSEAAQSHFHENAQTIRIGLTSGTLEFLKIALPVLDNAQYYARADSAKVSYTGKECLEMYNLLYNSIEHCFLRLDINFLGEVVSAFDALKVAAENDANIFAWAVGGSRVIERGSYMLNPRREKAESSSAVMLRYSLMKYYVKYYTAHSGEYIRINIGEVLKAL